MVTTLKEEAIKILRQNIKPMTCKQIIRKIKKRKKYKLRGETPRASLCSIIIRDIQKNKEKSHFIHLNDGRYSINKL